MTELERNKRISRRWHEAWGTPAILSVYEECLAPDFRAFFFGHGWIDRATYIERDQSFAAAFSDIRMAVDEIAAEGDLVFCRMTWRGKHIAAVPGLPPPGRYFEVMGFARDWFRDARIVEHIPLFDQFSLMKQLGGDLRR